MRLAYYSKKDNTFHTKRYNNKEECKRDFNKLKASGVPFCYTNIGMGFYGVAEYGLKHGKKSVSISDLPEAVAKYFDIQLTEDRLGNECEKEEFFYLCYEAEDWYSIRISLGEDEFENEVVNEYFITKDAKSYFGR